MRLKLIINSLTLLLFLLVAKDVLAVCDDTSPISACSGPCGTQTIRFSHTTNYPASACPANRCSSQECYDTNAGQTCQNPDPTNPYPAPGVCCGTTQCVICPDAGGCIYETADVLCNCDPTATPTPNPTNDPANPGSGDPTATPPPTSSIIQGSIHLDTTAALSGSYCFQAESSPLSLTGWTLNASKNANTYNASFLYISPNTYSINTATTGTGYTVSLDLSGQVDTNYVCSCPAAADPNNPYLCRYTGVTSPTANVNFYLREYNLSNNSWFQVFGSNYFAYNLISSPVPATTCEDDPDCIAALAAPNVDHDNPLSAGFAIVNTSNQNAVRSSASSSVYHAYFHSAGRPNNLNAYALNTDLAPLSYEYFYQLAKNSATEIGNGEDLEPLLNDFTSAPWWQADEVNYVKINGNISIDQTQGFQLSSDQQLVVFVDGNLNLDDSNPGDSI